MLFHDVLRNVAIVFVVLIGCNDTAQHSQEYSRHLDIEAYEFRRPLNEVWPKLLEVLGEYGYPVRSPAVEGVTVSSGLRGSGTGDGYRMLTHVVRIDATRFKIQLLHQYESTGQDGSIRHQIEGWNVIGCPTDPVMWALIERVDPVGAAALARREQESTARDRRARESRE
jgi:hypothetical protein